MRHPNRSWRVEETYVRVAGKWTYLYRAIDSAGDTIDFLVSPNRDLIAAKGFLRLALSAGRLRPRVINVDGHPAYASAISELKREGALGKTAGADRRIAAGPEYPKRTGSFAAQAPQFFRAGAHWLRYQSRLLIQQARHEVIGAERAHQSQRKTCAATMIRRLQSGLPLNAVADHVVIPQARAVHAAHVPRQAHHSVFLVGRELVRFEVFF
jgi:transposase-like protein